MKGNANSYSLVPLTEKQKRRLPSILHHNPRQSEGRKTWVDNDEERVAAGNVLASVFALCMAIFVLAGSFTLAVAPRDDKGNQGLVQQQYFGLQE